MSRPTQWPRWLLAMVVNIGFTYSSAMAWESDGHYMLTFWLATQAGFSRRDADEIAKGNQSYDDSDHHAAIPTVLWILLRGDRGAARDLQLKHFPSDAPLPSPPQRRLVVSNGPDARKAVEAAIQPSRSATALLGFGEALHPFHDSWSHSGVPDVPLRPGMRLRPNLSSAHPANRGGWSSHDADLTHLHVNEILELAQETYKLLRHFLDKNPRLREHQPVTWTKIEPIVRQFANARTKSQKNDWAVKYTSITSSAFTMTLTLPGPRAKIPGRVFKPPKQLGTKGSPALVEATNRFLDEWIRRQNVGAAVEFVDLNAMRNQFAGFPGSLGGSAEEARSSINQWSRKFLTMYLLDDHAAANSSGHGNSELKGYVELPESPVRDGRFR